MINERVSDGGGALAWRAFYQANSALTGLLERELEERSGLSLSQFEVLTYLGSSPDGRMRMQDLARSVLLSKSGVTRLVDRLAREGLVERAACESDRRVTYAAMTPKGADALALAEPVHRLAVEKHFAASLTEEEARVLAVALLKVFRHAASQLTLGCDPIPAGGSGLPAS